MGGLDGYKTTGDKPKQETQKFDSVEEAAEFESKSGEIIKKLKMDRKHILIAGIPGMGKTTIGNHLAGNHNLIHIDMEQPSITESFLAAPDDFIELLLTKARKQALFWHNAQKEARLILASNDAEKILAEINVANSSISELALSMLYLGEG